MAWTVTKVVHVYGDQRVVNLKLQADAATQTIETGLSVIEHFSVGAQSLTSGAPKIYANSNASGVQSNGVLGCSGFTSGDQLYVQVYGR